jgi:hypothetical protein
VTCVSYIELYKIFKCIVLCFFVSGLVDRQLLYKWFMIYVHHFGFLEAFNA